MTLHAPPTREFSTPRPSGRWLRFLQFLAALALLAAAGYGLYRYATYPAAPDPATADAPTLRAFIASDAFNNLTQAHRERLALGYVDRLRDQSFGDLLKSMLAQDPLRKRMSANVRRMDAKEKVGGAFLGLFLDKLDELNGAQRTAMLTAMAYAQQAEIARRADEFGQPTPDKFKSDMGRFLAHQPPRVQGQMGQFLIDLKRQRQYLGLSDPF